MKTTLAIITIFFLGACNAKITTFTGRVMVNKITKADTLCRRQNVRLQYTEHYGTVKNFSFKTETDTITANFRWHNSSFEDVIKGEDLQIFLPSKREARKQGIIILIQEKDRYTVVGAQCSTKKGFMRTRKK